MITSSSNQRIKHLVHLAEKSKYRRECDSFITEGSKMFLEADTAGIEEVYVSASFMEKELDKEIINKLSITGYEIVSDEVFKKISDTMTPQGILCVIKQYHYQPEDMLKKEAPLLLLLEDIQDPGNLGTMIRTAEGAGVDGVIMSSRTVDIYNPKVIRSTMGSIYRVPFFYSKNLIETIEELKRKDIAVYAAHLKGKKGYHQFDYRKPSAFLIGNEGKGLREETALAATDYMKIPMKGKVESLNAAVASVILMYEALRQREL